MGDRRNGVDVVVPCTNRKRLPVAKERRLRDHRARRLDDRFRSWVDALTMRDGGPAVPARELYMGEAWKETLRLAKTAGSHYRAVRLWIVSAGYGLIPASFEVRSYAATFTPGAPDDVVRGLTRLPASWWNELATWDHFGTDAPRSLADLAHEYPDDELVLVLSRSYLDATEDDVRAALQCRDRSILISAGRDLDGTSDQAAFDLRLRHELGGTPGSINQRTAARALELLDGRVMDRSWLGSRLRELTAAQPPLPTYDRRPMTDEQVRVWIERRLRRDPDIAKTTLLRAFRDAGLRCEQKRFGKLFEEVTAHV